uniref:Uncharacterized protein n=1 Tax=Arundo donax TaxID=35708 RepID=A0A0A9B7L8_ARUDO
MEERMSDGVLSTVGLGHPAKHGDDCRLNRGVGMKTGRKNPVPSGNRVPFIPAHFRIYGCYAGTGRKRDKRNRMRD